MMSRRPPRNFAYGIPRATTKALPGDARTHNLSLVLQHLYVDGPLSRADLARGTGLTRVTISDLVAELLGQGVAHELGRVARNRPGKPATLVDLDRSGHCVIGLDLSRADVFHGLVQHLDEKVVARAERPINGALGEEAFELVADLAAELVDSARGTLLGVGIGTPGVVDSQGVVRFAPFLGWEDLTLAQRLTDRLGVPVQVANDANVALLAERGWDQDDRDLLLVKIGHGVGAGLLLGGRPQFGMEGAAGEIGHVTVGTDSGPQCACQRYGCLEAWASAPQLDARLAEATGPTDRDAIRAEAGRRLGMVIAPVVGALNLAEVVITGPARLIDGPFTDTFADTLRDRTLSFFNAGLRVRAPRHGDDVVARGAVLMVLAERLGIS